MTNDEAKGVLFDMLGKGIYVKDTKENRAILVALRALEQEPCEDAVSREAVEDIVMWYDGQRELLNEIQKLPSVQPKPKTGHWIDDEFGSKCSCCGIHTHLDKFDRPMKFKHCSMCGAKMVEPQESEE